MRLDCSVWERFLLMDKLVVRPFLDFKELLHADQLDFYTDAALNGNRLGVGGRFGKFGLQELLE